MLSDIFSLTDWVIANETGERKLGVVLTGILFKTLKNAFLRALLLGSTLGWEIIHTLSSASKENVWLIGGLYVAFDSIAKLSDFILPEQSWVGLIVSLPMIGLNILIGGLIFKQSRSLIEYLRIDK